MFRIILLAAVTAGSPIVPAAAQTQTPAVAAKAQAPEAKKVCRRELATGSVMRKRVCRTQAEWDAITAQSQSDLERTQNMDRSRAAGNGNGGN